MLAWWTSQLRLQQWLQPHQPLSGAACFSECKQHQKPARMLSRPPNKTSKCEKEKKGTLRTQPCEECREKERTFEIGLCFVSGSIPTEEEFARIIPFLFSAEYLSKYSYGSACPETSIARAFALSLKMNFKVREGNTASDTLKRSVIQLVYHSCD